MAVRRQLWPVLAIAIIGAGVAAVLSLRQAPVYAADATLLLRDETRSLPSLGGVIQPSVPLAAASADSATRPRLLAQVKTDLRSPLSVGQLRQSVSATADAQSNLVVIRAQTASGPGAAALANAVAQRAAGSVAEASRRRFRDAAGALRARLPSSGRGSDPQRSDPPQPLSILETLATVSSPALVLRRAEPADLPVSPRPVRNTILGLVLGLTIGLGAAFLVRRL